MDTCKGRSFEIFCGLVLVLASTLYLLQAFTPLRLTSDSIYYLTMADTAARGNAFVAHEQPIGYPVFVFLLIKAGIFSSATMVLSNCLFFGLGLAFSFLTLLALGFSRRLALGACLFTLLSFAAVKHITLGMSDFLFFALAGCAGWVLTRNGHWRWPALALLVFCAVEVRFMGLALVCPVAVAAWPHVKRYRAWLFVAGTALLIAVAAGLWVGRHYFSYNLGLLHRFGLLHFVWRALAWHSQDFGELLLNAPLSKLPHGFRTPVLLAGAVAMFLFFAGTVAVWSGSQWLSAYLIACCLLILPWPYTDPRFWLHILPFVVVAIVLGVQAVAEKLHCSFAGLPAGLAFAYAVVFCCLGLAALGYSTWITFSGPQFPYRYGDGLLRPTYLTGCSSPASDRTDSRSLHLLRVYEWHCPPAPAADAVPGAP